MAVIDKITGAVSTHEQDWESIDWSLVNHEVLKLQVRIAKATREGRWNKVKSLQWILTHSFSARCKAVKRVTENKGSKTPGVDGILLKTPGQKMRETKLLQRRDYKPLPLRRIFIPKSNGKKRPLGIPSIHDRCMQALHMFALLPVSEMLADWDSYGFRPERSTTDAIEKLFICLAKSKSGQWVLEGDIRGCFDHINHDWLRSNICMDKIILDKWLKCGFMENGRFFPTKEGTPQGGIISPTLANMTLDGIEDMLGRAFGSKKLDGGSGQRTRKGIHFVRYADDFVVVGRTRDILEKEVKPLITEFLKERGLELSDEKTKITHISKGFDFLGQNIRKYQMDKTKGKLLIKPSGKNVKTFLTDTKAIIASMRNASQEDLIRRLNPRIIGWGNYHRHVVSKAIFNKVDHTIWIALWKWAKRRHSNKKKAWVASKYLRTIKGDNKSFSIVLKNEKGTSVLALRKASEIPIIRHTKIKGAFQAFNPAFSDYLQRRTCKKLRANRNGLGLVEKLWNQQNGICPICMENINSTDYWRIQTDTDHIGKDVVNESSVLVHVKCKSTNGLLKRVHGKQELLSVEDNYYST